MAISKNNALTHGASGMIGGVIVLKNYNGKTVIANRPKKPTKQSPLQKENRTKFRRATAFAKQMMADPVKKAEYWEKAKELNLPNAYTAAITEFMRKTEIDDLDVSAYSGKANEKISVKAGKKSFEVGQVEIVISSAQGSIETGKATRIYGNEWSYTTSITFENPKELKIVIRARDRAGNYTELKRIIFNQLIKDASRLLLL
jgi:hypothetical protein